MFVLLQIYSCDSRQLFLSLMIIILECNIVSARLIPCFHTWCRCWWCRCSCKEYTYKRSNIKCYCCRASKNFETTYYYSKSILRLMISLCLLGLLTSQIVFSPEAFEVFVYQLIMIITLCYLVNMVKTFYQGNLNCVIYDLCSNSNTVEGSLRGISIVPTPRYYRPPSCFPK